MEPIRLGDCVADRSDNLISDDASGLMQLSHAILSDATGEIRSFDDLYRADKGEYQLLWRRFFEEQLVPIRLGERRVIGRTHVLTWNTDQREVPT